MKIRYIQAQCVVCGKFFDVTIDSKTKKILSDCFYGGKHRFGTSYSKYRVKQDEQGKIIHDKNDNWILEHTYPWYKELWYELIKLKRTILHQYREAEYWECPDCKVIEIES